MISIIFLILFVNAEEKNDERAFEAITSEKKAFFDKLFEVAPLFQTEDSIFEAIQEGDLPITTLNDYAFLPYTDIVADILDANYTYALLDKDSIEIVDSIPFLKKYNFSELTNDTVISYHSNEDGYVKVYIYKTPSNKLWCFWVSDGKMIDEQTKEFAILVALLLVITSLFNLGFIFKINQEYFKKNEKK
jgi:hypothetical protein